MEPVVKLALTDGILESAIEGRSMVIIRLDNQQKLDAILSTRLGFANDTTREEADGIEEAIESASKPIDIDKLSTLPGLVSEKDECVGIDLKYITSVTKESIVEIFNEIYGAATEYLHPKSC